MRMFVLLVLTSKLLKFPNDLQSFAAMESNCARNEITEYQFHGPPASCTENGSLEHWAEHGNLYAVSPTA